MVEIQQLPPSFLETLGQVVVAIVFLVGYLLASLLYPQGQDEALAAVCGILECCPPEPGA